MQYSTLIPDRWPSGPRRQLRACINGSPSLHSFIRCPEDTVSFIFLFARCLSNREHVPRVAMFARLPFASLQRTTFRSICLDLIQIILLSSTSSRSSYPLGFTDISSEQALIEVTTRWRLHHAEMKMHLPRNPVSRRT